MKYLLVIAVVLVAFWIWRNNRQADRGNDRPHTPGPNSGPTRMVACSHCGTHVPESEQLAGRRGVYCCAEHRRLAQDIGS